MILFLDFETKDPYIDRGLGDGWTYKLNVPTSDFEVLGASYAVDDGEATYTTDMDEIKYMVSRNDTVVMHNAMYDMGCLETLGVDTSKLTLIDTKVMAFLHDSSLMSYSLSALTQKYCRIHKDSRSLANAALEAGVYPHTKTYIKKKSQGEDPAVDYAKVEKWVMKNMDIMQKFCFEAVATYANRDVDSMRELYKVLKPTSDMLMVHKYSSVIHVLLDYRKRGIRIDKDRAQEALNFLNIKIVDCYDKCYHLAGGEFNVNSTEQVSELLSKFGLECPRTPKGNPSVPAEWMSEQDHPICRAIIETKKYLKIKTDFIGKILEMQKFSCPGNGRYGRVFPEFKLFGARTGRLSAGNPNIQQIPGRDPVLGPLCRAIFLPEEGERMYSLDFKSQEIRIQVHYAYALNCKGSHEFRTKFNNDPMFDAHASVAKMIGIDKQKAKTINLGLSYSMGIATLADDLGVSQAQARLLRSKYNQMVPFLKELDTKCKDVLKTRGAIKTLGGRYLKKDDPIECKEGIKTFEYKALNKLIQGSAADQIMQCMLDAHKEGIKVLFPIHDQLVMSGTKEQAIRLKEIMETCVKLHVPVIAEGDLEGGDSWAAAGH